MIVFLGIYRSCCPESLFVPGDLIIFTDACQEGEARPFSPEVPDLPRYDARIGGRALPFQEITPIHSGLECLLGGGGILLPRLARPLRPIICLFADLPLPEHQHLDQWPPRTNLPDSKGKQNMYRNI